MSRPQLSTHEAKTVMLAASGLCRPPEAPATKRKVLQTIKQMGALQIDTISVVARSPYFVLWSRLGSYEQVWLDELLAEGKLFEYWSHEACFLPIEDYPLYRHRMIATDTKSWKRSREWIDSHTEEVSHVLNRIREQGSVRSQDFVRTDGKSGGWWEWKPEKRALEMLFTSGELMIARRHNFHRIYDLRERVLPEWDDSKLPLQDEVRRLLVLKAVRALGITTAAWVGDYFRTNKRETATLTRQLGDEGKLLTVNIAEWNETAYVHPANCKLIKAAKSGALRPELTTLLSPFDPLVWDRARASAMFGFDYRIECYTPAQKRHYGYFTLPILRHDALIGRLDGKAHRREGYFEIKSIYFETNVKVTDEMIADCALAVRECAVWHRTPEVVIRRTEPPEFIDAMRAHFI